MLCGLRLLQITNLRDDRMFEIFDHIFRFLERLLSIGGIAGLIALGITAAICFRYVEHGPEEIPQILTYSLSTIIGFYFGTGVARAGTNDPGAAKPAPTASEPN